MEVLYPHCAGLDVHKETVVACVRHMVDGTVKREVRTFDTTTTGLLALADWLASEHCTHVAMEATGVRVYSVDQSYQAYGAISSRGAVRVTVVRGNQSASGSGRLSHTSGAGRWRSFRGECSGTWSATRHPAYY
jgi:transposase